MVHACSGDQVGELTQQIYANNSGYCLYPSEGCIGYLMREGLHYICKMYVTKACLPHSGNTPVGYVLRTEWDERVARVYVNRMRRWTSRAEENVRHPSAGMWPDARRVLRSITGRWEEYGRAELHLCLAEGCGVLFRYPRRNYRKS
jgi:hypothetical protein